MINELIFWQNITVLMTIITVVTIAISLLIGWILWDGRKDRIGQILTIKKLKKQQTSTDANYS